MTIYFILQIITEKYMSHRMYWNHDGCVVKIYGHITFTDIDNVDSEICSNYDFDNINYIVRDLSAIQSKAISQFEIEIAAHINLGMSLYNKKIKGAFILNNKNIENDVNFYIETSKNIQNPWEHRIFSNIDDAIVWVKN